MKRLHASKKCLLLLEFGIPHYRHFIYKYFESIFNDFKIIHSGERFKINNDFANDKCINIKLNKNTSFSFFDFTKIKKYDVVISTLNLRKLHTWVPFIFYFKKKWIFWGQGVSKNNNGFLNYLRKKIINNSIGYVAYTEKGKKELIKLGVHHDKISIAYNTLKINNAELTWGSDYLLYVGRIQERKGIVKAIISLKNTNYRLMIVGNGEYVEVLKKIVVNNKLDEQVKFIDEVYDDEKLKKLFSQAIAYVSPDHVGLGVVHSFAYGVPVITCRNRDHAPEFEYCNNSNSYLYNHDSEIPNIFNEVYKNDNSRELRKKSAYNFYIEKLNYKNVIDAFDYHLKKIK